MIEVFVMNKTRFLTRTAVALALVVVAQLLGKVLPAGAVIVGPFSMSQLITGSLVNCVLLVTMGINGVWSGLIVGLVSPILAFLLGIGPALFVITPVVAVGNAIIVAAAHLLKKAGVVVDIIVPAVLKCAFLWLAVPALLNMVGAPEKQAKAMSIMFSWPQGVTALIGGFLAMLVLKYYREAKN